MKVIFEVVEGSKGYSFYVGDENGGHRLAGSKPWGAGKIVHSFKVNLDELRRELDGIERAAKEEEEIN